MGEAGTKLRLQRVSVPQCFRGISLQLGWPSVKATQRSRPYKQRSERRIIVHGVKYARPAMSTSAKLEPDPRRRSNTCFAKFEEAFAIPWLGIPTKGDYEDGGWVMIMKIFG